MDADAIGILRDHIFTFVQYLEKNQNEYFCNEYEMMSEDYLAQQSI